MFLKSQLNLYASMLDRLSEDLSYQSIALKPLGSSVCAVSGYVTIELLALITYLFDTLN